MEQHIYDALKEANVPLDSHYSDLYAEATPDAVRIIGEYRREGKIGPVSTFKSNIDGKRWYDIPFAYAPYWDAVAEKCRAI